MAFYIIGDIQGCYNELESLLQKIDFSPSRDTLYLLGDLVNRGPDNVKVLQTLMQYGSSACALLGNHDLHLLCVSEGFGQIQALDTIDDILKHPEASSMLLWLKQQHLAHFAHGWLMVHAGVLPSWTIEKTLALAQEVEAALQHNSADLLRFLYGNAPAYWSQEHQGIARYRSIINALTRLRFCDQNGHMDFDCKEDLSLAPSHLIPWFNMPDRATQNDRIAFGHWSTLHDRFQNPRLLPLDTGCVWGGALTLACIQEKTGLIEYIDSVHASDSKPQRPMPSAL